MDRSSWRRLRGASALAAIGTVLIGCASIDTRANTRFEANGSSASCERGFIEQIGAVTLGPGGPAIVEYDANRSDFSIYARPSEQEVDVAMVDAARAALQFSESPAMSGRAGVVYMVRLACGGLVYVYETGAPRYRLASQVVVEFGLQPRLSGL